MSELFDEDGQIAGDVASWWEMEYLCSESN